MSEWNVPGPYQQQQRPVAPGQPAGAGSGVEWYSGGAQQYAATSYSYEVPRGGRSAAAYGSFEDEAPLLEGGCTTQRHRPTDACMQHPGSLRCNWRSASSVLTVAAAGLPSTSDLPAAELGIDIPAILSRTRSILTLRLSGHDMDHLDLGGPLIFMAMLGAAHLLVC